VYLHDSPTSLPRLILRTPKDLILRALFLALATWPFVVVALLVKSFLV
jgi:hypothetical protein